MARQSEYIVNRGPLAKDTSLRSFICALLVFLALCIIIYLILAFTTGKKDKEESRQQIIGEKEAVVFDNIGKSESEKIQMIGPLHTTEKQYQKIADPVTDLADIDEVHQISSSVEPTVTVDEEIITPRKKNVTASVKNIFIFTTETPKENDINTRSSTKQSNLYERTETGDIGLHNSVFRQGYLTTTDVLEDTTNTPNLRTTPVYSHQQNKPNNNITRSVVTVSEETQPSSITEPSIDTTNATETSTTLAYQSTSITNVVQYTTKSIFATETIGSSFSKSTTETKNPLNPNITTNKETQPSSITKPSMDTTNATDTSTTLAYQSTPITNVVQYITKSVFSTENSGSSFSKSTITTKNLLNPNITTDEADLISTTDKLGVDMSRVEQSTAVTTSSTNKKVYVATATAKNFVVTTTETSRPLLSTKQHLYNSQPVNFVSAATPAPSPTCSTNKCKRSASRLLYLMNHEQDSCENFYDFACGGNQINEELINSKNLKYLIHNLYKKNSTTDKYMMDFKIFYESCLFHEQNFLFSERLSFLYDMPNLNLTELFVDLILNQSMPLFNIGLDINIQNKTYIYELTLPGKSSLIVNIEGWSLLEQIKTECLNNLKLYGSDIDLDSVYDSLGDCQNDTFYSISKNFIEQMNLMKQFPAPYDHIYSKENLNNLVQMIRYIQEVEGVEYKVREVMASREYGYCTIGNLNSTTGYELVDWVAIFQKLTFYCVVDDHNINMYFRSEISNIFQKLQKFSEREVIDMLWLYSRLQLYVNTVIPNANRNIEMHCMSLTKQLMPDVVLSMIYDNYKQKNMFNTVHTLRKLFDKLKHTLEISITKRITDDGLRKLFKEKLNDIKLGLITTGDHATVKSNNKYVKLKTNNFQANVMELLRNYKKIVYSLESKNTSSPATLLGYFVDPFDSKPKSFYTSEYIVIQPFFLERVANELPYSIKLATIGMDLSKQLTKHFDPIGITLPAIPDSDDYYKELKQRTRFMLDLYTDSNYTIQGSVLTFQINQSMWLNQMIADNAAFRIVFDSFSTLTKDHNLPWVFHDYAMEKVFFLAMAQEYCGEYTVVDFLRDAYMTGHLPPPLQIHNIIRNTKQFMDIFECTDGSGMMMSGDLITQFPYMNFTGSDSGSLSN